MVKSLGFDRVFSDLLLPTVSSLMLSSCTREENAVAIEISAGVIRACKSVPEELLGVIDENFASATTDFTSDFVAGLRWAIYHRDPKRLGSLEALILKWLSVHQNSSPVLARSLRCLNALLVEFDWQHQEALSKAFSMVSSTLLSHPYKQVRVQAAKMLSFLLASFRSTETLDFAPLFVATGEEAADVSRLRDTLLSFLNDSVMQRRTGKLEPIYEKVLAFIFEAHNDAEKDVSKEAKALTMTQALSWFKVDTIESKIYPTLQGLSESESYKIRASLPAVLTLMEFNHRFVPHASAMPLIDKLLLDSNVEVRNVAELALRSALTGQLNEKSVADLSKKYAAWLDGGEKTAHSGMLGFQAIILSYAYTVPPYLVPVILKCVSSSRKKGSVGEVGRSCIAEFWRTQKDGFEQYEELFTSDQMRDLRELTLSPSYYA
jgi:hypothetical protein